MDPDEEEIEVVFLDDEIEFHCIMVFKDGNGVVDGAKALLHAKKCDVYNSDKEALVKGGYCYHWVYISLNFIK